MGGLPPLPEAASAWGGYGVGSGQGSEGAAAGPAGGAGAGGADGSAEGEHGDPGGLPPSSLAVSSSDPEDAAAWEPPPALLPEPPAADEPTPKRLKSSATLAAEELERVRCRWHRPASVREEGVSGMSPLFSISRAAPRYHMFTRAFSRHIYFPRFPICGCCKRFV